MALSMIRSGELVRTHHGSHRLVTAATWRRQRSRTPFTVVALKSDCADEWKIAACLREVVVRDDAWVLLPSEEEWTRYGGTFYAATGEEAVQAALADWADSDDDEDGDGSCRSCSDVRDADGYDGECGNCADRRYAHEEGEHEGAPRDDCAACQGS
ncbi:hypothetical protein ACWGJT_32730 [Streptomyces xantholiticus]